MEAARRVQDIFMNSCLRVYTNSDIEGVELCGAVKNIIALAAGIATGLGYGDNARAALITRGMAEITRLGTAMGCSERTFPGLAGMGDLIVTATSRHSRNNRCGQLIGEGVPPKEAIARIGMVVEGINALDATMQLARRYGVEMPITEAVDQIVHQGLRPRDVVYGLMTREKASENPAGQ
jgi:glycerol-3-phosphate dehydrogenase (NAD(P)+)